MGRWSHLDTDEERLPEGMTRVGYDADTQVYTYRDSRGSYWEGAPGCRYGKLYRVRSATPPLPSVHIPNDVTGEEAPYVIYDNDSDSDSDSDGIDNEKRGTPPLASPGKALLRTPLAAPRRSKELPDLPFAAHDETDSLSGTTARESICAASEDTYVGKSNAKSQQGLRRSGTLSRIARFLTSASSSSPRDRRSRSRRATLNGGEEATAGHRRGANGGSSRGATAAARWPGTPVGPASPPAMRRRATTFDEILAGR